MLTLRPRTRAVGTTRWRVLLRSALLALVPSLGSGCADNNRAERMYQVNDARHLTIDEKETLYYWQCPYDCDTFMTRVGPAAASENTIRDSYRLTDNMVGGGRILTLKDTVFTRVQPEENNGARRVLALQKNQAGFEVYQPPSELDAFDVSDFGVDQDQRVFTWYVDLESAAVYLVEHRGDHSRVQFGLPLHDEDINDYNIPGRTEVDSTGIYFDFRDHVYLANKKDWDDVSDELPPLQEPELLSDGSIGGHHGRKLYVVKRSGANDEGLRVDEFDLKRDTTQKVTAFNDAETRVRSYFVSPDIVFWSNGYEIYRLPFGENGQGELIWTVNKKDTPWVDFDELEIQSLGFLGYSNEILYYAMTNMRMDGQEYVYRLPIK